MADGSPDTPRRPAGAGRVPPHNLDAEASLLGAMLLSASAIASAVEVVSREDFYKPAHGHIFEAITSLYGSGEPIDPVTVAEELRRANLLDAIGGPAVLVDLQATTPAISNAAGYARIVEEHALLRRMIGVAGEIAELGYSLPDDVTKAVDRAEAMVYDVAQRRVADTMAPVHDLLEVSLSRLEQLYDRGESITGLPTGYTDLDELLSGLQPSSLVVVGARPSVGKCVAWDTPILDPVTGALRTAAEVHRLGVSGHPVSVASLGGDGSLRVVEPEAFVDDGIKPVFRVRTRSGREVRTTITHPFLTERGWLPLGDLGVGVRVAVPHALPYFGTDRLPAAEVVLLAHLIGHGQRVAGGAVFANTSPTVVADLVVHAHGQGVRTVPLPRGHVAYRVVAKAGARDRIEVVAARHGLLGVATDRGIPDAVYRLPHDQLALFLGRLFATGGAARAAARGAGRIRYRSASRAMTQGVQHLLLRFGVASAVREKRVCEEGVTHDLFELEVTDAEDIRAFCDQIEVVGQERSFEVLSRRAGGAGSGLAVGARAKWPRGGPIDLLSGARRPAGQVLERAPDPRALQNSALWDEIVEIAYDGMEQVYDLTVPVTHNFVAGDVFVHNTAFALGMAAHAALEAQRPVLFFSLEMGHLELTQRLLSAEARVDSTRLRNGRLVEADWSKIGHAIGRLANAPLWVDENPNVTVMEIRAKARRLKSRIGDLGLVVVDYLQLMSGRGSAESRQVEVSEISRGLKILARELETPVVALSQLSRALELRADKRPMLADLRESGCLTGDTLITRADTGGRVPIGELAASGERDIPVWTLTEDLKLVPGVMTHAFSTGKKRVFEVRLASGRRVRASGNHPLLRFEGWARADELHPGDRVAVARGVAAPSTETYMGADELVLLAHMIGDGCAVKRQPIHYTSADLACLDAVEKASASFGITARRVAQGNWWHLYLPSPHRLTHGRRNPIAEWLDGFGLFDKRSFEKFVPAQVFGVDDDGVRLFLRHLWATDGNISQTPNRPRPSVYYGTSSHRLADDVQALLTRLGILSSIRRIPDPRGYRPMYQVWITDRDALVDFLTLIGSHGARGESVAPCLSALSTAGNPNLDTIPAAVWDQVRHAMPSAEVTTGELARRLEMSYCGSALYESGVSRSRLRRVSEIVEDRWLHSLATSDVLWDTVCEVEVVGEEEVFDATVSGTHNFLANGVVVHNSIEQDADVVVFLYRDEVHNPDSPDIGTAEILIAKHRNGPTGKVKLAYLSQYTRFANMARGV